MAISKSEMNGDKPVYLPKEKDPLETALKSISSLFIKLSSFSKRLDDMFEPEAVMAKEHMQFLLDYNRANGQAAMESFTYNKLLLQYELVMKELDIKERQIQIELLQSNEAKDLGLMKELADINIIKANAKKIEEEIKLLKTKIKKEKIDTKVKKSYADVTIGENDNTRGGFGDD